MAKNVILGIGAHPDDTDFTASGTMAKLVEEGWEAYYVVCTDGSRGSRHHDMSHTDLARTRREEQQEAGRILGLTDVFFLKHVDTQLACDVELKEDLVRVIRTIHPKVVVTMDPYFLYSPTSLWSGKAVVNHTDHRAASMAAMDAVYPMARDRSIFPEHLTEGLDTHITEELWFTSFDGRSNHIVDITSTFAKKVRALEAHKSQFDDLEGLRKDITNHAKSFCKDNNYEYAEGFIRLVFD